MGIYETDRLTLSQKNQFNEWFDEEIGTESETNEQDFNTFTIMFFDLTPREVEKIRKYEREIIDKKSIVENLCAVPDLKDYHNCQSIETDTKKRKLKA